jgi:hypothetical protein
MNLIECVYLRFKARQLNKFAFHRSSAFRLRDKFADYNELLPVIEKCYNTVGYWHGTGRFHYSDARVTPNKNDDSCYVDILQGIINKNGLIVHSDLFAPIEFRNVGTISLTRCRMYGRCYAEVHQYEKKPLIYVYGNTLFWFKVIVVLQVFKFFQSKNTSKYFTFVFSEYLGRLAKERMLKWIRLIRKIPFTKKFCCLYRLRSDILNNYGILIGINKNFQPTFDFDPVAERFECRTANNIALSDFTHLEVPFDIVNDVKSVLLKNEIVLPVIPIEFAERFCNRYSLEDLMSS